MNFFLRWRGFLIANGASLFAGEGLSISSSDASALPLVAAKSMVRDGY